MPAMMRETSLGPPVSAKFEQIRLHEAALGHCYETAERNELSINIAGQEYPLDKVIRCTSSDDEWFVYINMKLSLNAECMEQAMRLTGIADYIINAVPALTKSVSRGHHIRREKCIEKHIGLWYVQPSGSVDIFCDAHRRNADNARLATAFAIHDGSHDAPAGVASALRMTDDRARLCRLAEWLKGQPEWAAEFSEIHKLADWRNSTAHQLRKLIRENSDLPVQAHGHARTIFYVERAE